LTYSEPGILLKCPEFLNIRLWQYLHPREGKAGFEEFLEKLQQKYASFLDKEIFL
jgi:hypothetical protein